MARPPKKYSNLSKAEIKFIKKQLGITKIQDIDTAILKESLKDTRNKNMISFKLWDVIICVILASFADCDDWEEIHEFVLAVLSRAKPKYKKSLKIIRKHLSNNFEAFLPELFCYLMLN